MATTVKAVTRVTGPFPQIQNGSLICPARAVSNPLVLLVVEIVNSRQATCMVIDPGHTTYRYGYVAKWDQTEFVMWQGEVTITQ